MSKVAIKGNASGTATYTLEAPAGSTDRTLNLPDEAGTVITSASDIESQVKTATNATGSAPIYACRAWVNFNGTTNTGGNCDIRASGNVSSVTDSGTGQYTVNFTTAMPDANYAIQITAAGTGSFADWSEAQWYVQSTVTTSSFKMENVDESNSYYDSSGLSITVFR